MFVVMAQAYVCERVHVSSSSSWKLPPVLVRDLAFQGDCIYICIYKYIYICLCVCVCMFSFSCVGCVCGLF